MQSNQDLKVSVFMTTYNHAPFIGQAIEGVVMQKTNFPIKLFIGEDCSTDETRMLCERYKSKYPDKIELVLREQNLGANANSPEIYEKCVAYGKYTAMCEGDDYWTDLLKLQRQVDFLEANPNYTICWTKYKILEDENILLPDWLPIIEGKQVYDINLDNVFTPYSTYTLTAVFKSVVLVDKQYQNFRNFKDDVLYCMCLSQGKGAILNFFSGIYRVHNGGIFSSSNNFDKAFNGFCTIKDIIAKIDGCNNYNLNQLKDNLLKLALYIACNQRQTAKTFQQIIKAYKFILREFPLRNNLGNTKAVVKQSMSLLKNYLIKSAS